MAEQVLDRFLLSIELIFKDLDLGLEFDAVVTKLVIEHFHLDCLVVQLFLLFGLQSVLSLGLSRPRRMRQSRGQAGTHYGVVWVGTVSRAKSI